MAKTPCRHEIVSEKNPQVANLIRCLSDETWARCLWDRTRKRVVSESEFKDCEQYLLSQAVELEAVLADGDCDFAVAEAFLVVSWQGPSGLAGTTRKPRFAVRNTTSGGTVVARWKAVADSIPEWHERLRGVEFRCRDAFELIAACPDREGTVIYCDPPYLADSRTGGSYLHDFTDADHERLATDLSRFKKTRVVVSLYDSPDANRLYAGWRKVPIEAPRKLKHATGGTHERVEAGEVVFINRD